MYRFSRPANKIRNTTNWDIFITHKRHTDIYSIAIYHIFPLQLIASNSETNQSVAIRVRSSTTVPVDISVFLQTRKFQLWLRMIVLLSTSSRSTYSPKHQVHKEPRELVTFACRIRHKLRKPQRYPCAFRLIPSRRGRKPQYAPHRLQDAEKNLLRSSKRLR